MSKLLMTGVTTAILLAIACRSGPESATRLDKSPSGLKENAAAFYEAYGTALAAPHRDAIAGFYHPDGAMIVFNGHPRRSTRAALDSRYRGSWSPPTFFSWEGLAFDSVGPGQVIVTGGFRWQASGQSDTSAFVYAALLETVGSGMAIRFEHETSKPGGDRGATVPRATEVPAPLKTAGAEWDRLFNSGDTAGLAALYADDVASMPFNAPTIHGRPALRADFEKFLSQNRGHHETLVEEILATDDWAIERARYVLTYTPRSAGREVKETGRHVVCRKKKNGVWQIAWELWNTDTPPPQ